jgi:hypothetical protein
LFAEIESQAFAKQKKLMSVLPSTTVAYWGEFFDVRQRRRSGDPVAIVTNPR